MKIKILLLNIIFVVSITESYAQEITGFWEITHVSMQGQSMTPVAKWTKINKNGTYQSGNGWLQNAVGTWTYDEGTHQFSPTETNGIEDDFGPFSVSFQDETMLWKRMEDGAEVTVELERIDHLPMSTADRIKGIWDLTTITENGNDITATYDPDNLHYLFIRWDRIYQARNTEGESESGYWHIHGHRPEITLLSHIQGKEPKSWRVDVSEKELVLTGISDSNKNQVMAFSRIHRFPN